MALKSYVTGDVLMQYAMKEGFRPQEILTEIKKVTQESSSIPQMMLDELEGQLFRVILKIMNAKKCLEIGVFTGYNAVNMALALPEDGKVIGLDITDADVNLGKKIWTKYGLDKKIDIRIGDAKDTLQSLIDNGQEGTFDFILIDAKKTDYDDYYEKSLKLVRVNGLIAIDNVLWDGLVTEDESKHDASTKALHALNKKVKLDPRVEPAMTLLGDGVTFCRKI